MPKVTVKEGDKEMTVFYPDTGDRVETEDLRQFAIGKTREDLKKQTRDKPKYNQKQSAEVLKEAAQWRAEKQKKEANNENTRRYF